LQDKKTTGKELAEGDAHQRPLFHFRRAHLLYCDAMLKKVLEQGREAADAALERLLPSPSQHPTSIHQAMRHSVFAGGKRLRPILCMEAGRMIAATSQSRPSASLPAGIPPGIDEVGAALEMLHTYSLIHDDLPALDNDELRRGRPTCHKAFGEATAILAGDALQTLAYEVLSQIKCPAESCVAIIREIAHATGTIDGMIGGQVVDLEAEHKKPDLPTLEYIHRSKTAALITASAVTGGMYAGATAADINRLRTYGQSIGLAFQIVDDVLDLTQTSEQLGKTAGKDAAAEKTTYPALFGIEESLSKADALVKQACAELAAYGEQASTLKDLAHYLVDRKK
jgi:geranylgeranyl diphosphate synthase type II